MSHYSLKTIFESSGSLRRIHLPQEYAPLERYLQNDVIKLEPLQLSPIPDGMQSQVVTFLATQPQRLWEMQLSQAIPVLANIENGGGLAHQLLCWHAAAWLLDQGYQVSPEQRFAGKRVDLVTPCRHWLIECGDTSPVPVARHFLRGITNIAVVPFQEQIAPDIVHAFIFSKGKSWDSAVVQKDLVIRLGDG